MDEDFQHFPYFSIFSLRCFSLLLLRDLICDIFDQHEASVSGRAEDQNSFSIGRPVKVISGLILVNIADFGFALTGQIQPQEIVSPFRLLINYRSAVRRLKNPWVDYRNLLFQNFAESLPGLEFNYPDQISKLFDGFVVNRGDVG